MVFNRKRVFFSFWFNIESLDFYLELMSILLSKIYKYDYIDWVLVMLSLSILCILNQYVRNTLGWGRRKKILNIYDLLHMCSKEKVYDLK